MSSSRDAATIVAHPEKSLSTDSEESFLIKQLNKSQLFNSSSSNAEEDLSVEGSRKSQLLDERHPTQKRKSLFLESYTDENGHNRTFNVFQDSINETSNDSRDISLSGLSSLNADHLHQALSEVSQNRNSLNSISSPVTDDKSFPRPFKNSTILRDTVLGNNPINRLSRISIPRFERLHKSSNDTNNHSSSGSTRSSQYGPTPSTANIAQFVSSSNTQPVLHAPSTQNYYDTLSSDLNYPRVKTPDYPAPDPPIRDNSSRGSFFSEDMVVPADVSRGLTADIINDETQLKDEDEHAFEVPGKSILPTDTRSSSKSSYKSAQSSAGNSGNTQYATRQSILHYESSRKKASGTPHLLFSRNESIQHLAQQPQPDIRISTAGTNNGLTPFIEPTPTDSQFPFSDLSDDASIREGRAAKMARKAQVSLKTVTYKDPQTIANPQEPELHDSLSFSTNSSANSNHNLNEKSEPHYNDQLLEKIHYYRTQPVRVRSPSSNDTLIWILYLISFVIPPLFFFLGFGLLDQHIGGKVSPQIKRLSIVTGILYVLMALAMIGVGFGVGITLAQ